MTISKSTIRLARQSGNPVIKGQRATFIWEGKIAPNFMSDLNGWGERPSPFKRVSPALIPNPIKPTWSYTLTLPRDAYLEYVFHDPINQTRLLDPLNRRSVNNGVGSRNNFFYMPGARPSPFSTRRADVPAGIVTRHRVEAFILQEDSERDVYLYKPPVKGPVPLLTVYDGVDYLQRAKLAVVVDNLIADKRIRPIAMAFLQNGKRMRSVEYACSDATILWLEYTILPLARKHLKLLDIKKYPSTYGVLGASFLIVSPRLGLPVATVVDPEAGHPQPHPHLGAAVVVDRKVERLLCTRDSRGRFGPALEATPPSPRRVRRP